MGRRFYFTLLKIGAGVGLIILLLHMAPLREVGADLRNANPGYLLLAAVVYLAGLLVGPLRWSKLLSVKGIEVSFRKLASYFFIGLFFNNFLPTIVGGDVARATYVAMDSKKKSEAFASTIVDRAIGFFALTVIVLFITLGFSHVLMDKGVVLVAVALIFIVTGCAALLFKTSIFNRLSAMLPRIRWFNVGRGVANVYSSIYLYRRHKSTCLFAFGLSVVLQSSMIVSNYILGYSVGMRIAAVYFFLLIPIIAFVSMIPVTPNAIGVREWGYRLLFIQIGATEAQAVSLSVLNLFLVLLVSLIGGLLFVVRRERIKV